MTNYRDYYYCEECGHVVAVVVPGAPTLTCCGQDMVLLTAKTEDTGKEKHVPVVVADGDAVTVKLGSVPHPMTEEQHIEFIEVITKDGKNCRAQLEHTGEPEAAFNVKEQDIAAVFAFCNLHGLWTA